MATVARGLRGECVKVYFFPKSAMLQEEEGVYILPTCP
jgi:hypothetical protein